MFSTTAGRLPAGRQLTMTVHQPVGKTAQPKSPGCRSFYGTMYSFFLALEH
jgi:hypothetical protein